MYLVRNLKPANWRVFFIVILSYSLFTCNSKSAISENEKETFIKTYSELTILKPEFENSPEQYNIEKQKIFDRNEISEEWFTEFLEKIALQPEIQQEIFQRIAEILEDYEKQPRDSLRKILNASTIKP